MLLRKEKAGSTIGHVWENDGDVHDVPDQLAAELLAIPGGGFTEVAGDEATAVADETEVAAADEPADELKKPNQAASAADWTAYALAQGLPEDTVANASRKAIVDHFNGGASLTEE